MVAYIIRRLMLLPLLLFGVTVMIFGMLQFLSPVERSALYVRDIPKSENVVQGIIKRYGFDQPIYIQYWRWLAGFSEESGEFHPGILQGNFGYSRVGAQPVVDLIKQRSSFAFLVEAYYAHG